MLSVYAAMNVTIYALTLLWATDHKVRLFGGIMCMGGIIALLVGEV